MKINIVPTILAAAISALIGYALYSLCKTEGQEWLLAIGGGLSLFFPLTTTLGVRFADKRTSLNVAVASSVFVTLLLIEQIVFACIHQYLQPAYIITTGILLLLFFLITYSIAKTKV